MRGQAKWKQRFFLDPKINNSLELLQRLGVLLPTPQKKKIYFLCPYTHPVHFEIILLIDRINTSAVSNLIDAFFFSVEKIQFFVVTDLLQVNKG